MTIYEPLDNEQRRDFVSDIFSDKLVNDSYHRLNWAPGKGFGAIEMTPPDFLEQALEKMRPKAIDEMAMAKPVVTVPDKSKQDSTQEHLIAQKALMADPGALRRLLPELLVQADGNGDEELDRGEIDHALLRTDLPAQNREALNLFKNSFADFKPSVDKSPGLIQSGISDFDLAVLEKAMNRQIDHDPLYRHQLLRGIPRGLTNGAVVGLYSARNLPLWQRLAEGALFAVGGLVLDESMVFSNHYFFQNSSAYDRIQKDYQTALSHYPSGK